jgi:hypothetical protein
MTDRLYRDDVARLIGIKRTSLGRVPLPEPDGHIAHGSRTRPWWWESTIIKWIASRPGRGWRRGRLDYLDGPDKSVRVVAEMTGLSTWRVRDICRKLGIPVRNVGRTWMISPDGVDRIAQYGELAHEDGRSQHGVRRSQERERAIEHAIDLYAQGYSLRRAGAEVGVSGQAVLNWLRERGKPTR